MNIKEFVENLHLKAHKLAGDKNIKHKAGYWDYLAGFVIKEFSDIKNNLEELKELKNEVIDLENRLGKLDYKLHAILVRFEEYLSVKDDKNKGEISG